MAQRQITIKQIVAANKALEKLKPKETLQPPEKTIFTKLWQKLRIVKKGNLQ